MTDKEAQDLRRENTYLKTRCAQLQNDVDDLSAQLRRMQEQSGLTEGRRRPPPNPLSGGQ